MLSSSQIQLLREISDLIEKEGEGGYLSDSMSISSYEEADMDELINSRYIVVGEKIVAIDGFSYVRIKLTGRGRHRLLQQPPEG